MSDNPPTLLIQLANRLKSFSNNLGLSQKQVASLLKLDQGTLSKFLDGKAGVSSEMALKIVRLTSLTKRELDLKFGEKLSSRIMHLQEAGQPMRLDNSGWVPGLAGAGQDPDNSTDITETNDNPARDVPDDDEDEFLAGLHALHQSIIDKINARQARAKPNVNGVTSGPKAVDSNAKSKTPGSRGDLLSAQERQDHNRRVLTILNEATEEATEGLALEKAVKEAYRVTHKARRDLQEFRR